MSQVTDFLIPSAAYNADNNKPLTKGDSIAPAISAHAGPAGRNATDPLVYEGQSRTHTQLRDSYERQAMMLDYSIRGMMLEMPEAFVTTIYPMVETDDIAVEASSFKFNHVYVPEVPEEGVPRVVTAQKRTRRGKMKRRAIAIRGEVGAMSTAMGVEEFTLRARGMALCIIETMIMDTLFEITFSGSQQLERTSIYGPPNNLMLQATNERDITASLQRNDQQFGLWVLKFRHFMRTERKVSGSLALILAPESALYLQPISRRIAQGERFTLKEEINGTADLTGPQPIDSFGGMPVYEAPDLYVGTSESGSGATTAAAQMLTRNKITAEHFPMVFGERRRVPIYDGMGCADEDNCYSTDQRDIYLYDAYTDNMERVRFAEALEHAGLDAGGEPGDESFDADIPFNPADHEDNVRRNAKWNFYLDRRDGRPSRSKAVFAGELDLNVYEISDLRQAAQSIVGNLSGLSGAPADLYNKTVQLLRILEAVEPNERYIGDQIALNYGPNHNTRGEFVGENPNEVDPGAASESGWCDIEQWAGIATGGMAIPEYKKEYGAKTAPPFLANWTGLKQLQHMSYGDAKGWSEETCRLAAEVVPFWEALNEHLVAANSDNVLVNHAYRHPWEASASAGCVLFNLAFGSRIPVFYPDLKVRNGRGGAFQVKVGKQHYTRAPVYINVGLKNLLRGETVEEAPHDMEGMSVVAGNALRRSIRSTRNAVLFANVLATEPSTRASVNLSDTLADWYAVAMSIMAYDYELRDASAADREFEAASFANNLLGMTPLRAQAVVYYAMKQLGIPDEAIVAGSRIAFDRPNEVYDAEVAQKLLDVLMAINKNVAKIKGSKPPAYIKEAEEKIKSLGISDDKGGDLVRCIRANIDPGTVLSAGEGEDLEAVREASREAASTFWTEEREDEDEGAATAATGGNIVSSAWYRTPYTASPSQIRFLLSKIGLFPARMGDPRDGYTTPFEGVSGDEGERRGMGIPVPQWLTDRPEMDPLERVASKVDLHAGKLHVALAHEAVENQRTQQREAPIGSSFYGDMDIGAGYEDATRKSYADETSPLADALARVHSQNFQARLAQINGGSKGNGLLRAVMLACLGMRIDRFELFQSMMDSNVHIWFLNVLLLMPAAEFSFDSAIMLRPGSETGVNYFGHQSMMYGSNATVQNFLGSYALYTQAFTKDPEAIISIMDWRVRGYLGGASVRFFNRSMIIPEVIRNTPARDRPSLIATALPITEDRFPMVISPAGRFTDNTNLGVEYARNHYSSASWENVYGHQLYSMYEEEDYEGSPFHRETPSLPQVSFQGQVVKYEPGKGFTKFSKANSWRENACYPGALAVYNGQAPHFVPLAEVKEHVQMGNLF